MKKLLAVCLAAAMLLAVCACNKGGGGGGYEDPEPMLPETIAETGEYIVQNGQSDYTIVIPASAGQGVINAANELQMFLRDASGAELPIERDGGYVFDQTEKVISLGDTTVWQGSEQELSDDLRMTGYVMKRLGSTVVCNADSDGGVVSAVYDMLGYLIGYEYYAADEIAYEQKQNIPLLDFDLRFRPTVDVREILSKALSSDSAYNQRLRLFTSYGKGQWLSFAHTTISNFLPVSEYGSHTDWYNAAKSQVCYANDDMRAAMVEEIKDRIRNNEDGIYVMIGHEDNLDMCDCTDCAAAREKFGGYSGQELDFANKIAAEVAPWVEENYPGRTVKYVFFAYQTSAQPPVTYDEASGKYVPFYKDVQIHEDVMVQYCPIEADFSKEFNSVKNSAFYEQLKGWFDLFEHCGLADNIVIWTYSITSHSYIVPGNNFASYGEHYKTMADAGVSYIMDQFYHDSRIPCFEELRLYTMSKLMYRSDLSYNTLVNDFISQYYGEAADTIRQYYEFYRSYYMYLEETKALGGTVPFEYMTADFWPFEVVVRLADYLDSALEDIAPLRQTDPARYQKLYDRIMKEKVTPMFLMMNYYRNGMSDELKRQYWNDLNTYTKKYGIENTYENKFDVAGILEAWRTEIFG